MNPVNFDPCAAGCQRAARTRVMVPAHLPQEPWMCRWCERSIFVDHLIAQLSTVHKPPPLHSPMGIARQHRFRSATKADARAAVQVVAGRSADGSINGLIYNEPALMPFPELAVHQPTSELPVRLITSFRTDMVEVNLPHARRGPPTRQAASKAAASRSARRQRTQARSSRCRRATARCGAISPPGRTDTER
jgi:hypothetical protein